MVTTPEYILDSVCFVSVVPLNVSVLQVNLFSSFRSSFLAQNVFLCLSQLNIAVDVYCSFNQNLHQSPSSLQSPQITK